MATVLEAWDAHLADPVLPRTLSARLREAGFEDIRMDGHTFATNELVPDAYGGFLVPFAEQFVTEQELVDGELAKAWADEQRELGESGEFYFACIQFCFAATGSPLASPSGVPRRCSRPRAARPDQALRRRHPRPRDLDLEVPAGSFFGLLGPNGAGKTTLISAVCNLIRITEGEVARLRPARPHAWRRGARSASPSRSPTSTAS